VRLTASVRPAPVRLLRRRNPRMMSRRDYRPRSEACKRVSVNLSPF
jgi:hypothetical protein